MKRLIFARSRAGHRPRLTLIGLVTAVALTTMLVAIIGSGLALAQGNTPRQLKIGDTVTGTLDSKNFVQVYSFDGRNGDTISIVATSKASGLTLALALTDANGDSVSQAANLSGAEVSIKNLKIAADGIYYITVLRATGAQGAAKGDFTLALTGTAAANTGVTLTDGMSVALSWATTDDMSLEVRDPVGNAVNFRNPVLRNGAKLSGTPNKDCQNTTADNPTSTALWPKGNVASGSYEIIVYYNQACAAGSQNINFTVTVTVDGNVLDPIRGTLSVSQQYVTSFILTAADQISVQAGGVYDPNQPPDLTAFADVVKAPSPLVGGKASGTLGRARFADAFSFQATAGQTATIDMNAVSGGSLDSFVLLVDPSGNLATFNDDDQTRDTRDSKIVNFPLTAGTYVVVATRFAFQVGGTEGSYNLKVTLARASTGTSATPVPTSTTGQTVTGNLPSGSIQLTLTWNTRADVRLLVRDPAGRSVFTDAPTPDNSGILERQGNLNCKTTTTTPLTYMYWPNSLLPVGTYEVAVWLNDLCGSTESPAFSLTLSVRGKAISEFTVTDERADVNKNHYLRTFTVTDTTGSVTVRPGGTFFPTFTGDIRGALAEGAANPPAILEVGKPLTGTISLEGSYTLFKFDGKKDQKIRILERKITGNLDPFMFLMDANGTQLAFDDDIILSTAPLKTDQNSRIDYTLPADGLYVVVASRYGVDYGGTTGTFEVSIAPQP